MAVVRSAARSPLTSSAARRVGEGGNPLAIQPLSVNLTSVSTFASGWFHGGTATASTMAASDSEVGTHSAVTTATSGTNTWSIYNQAAVDMTARHFVVRVKMDDFTAIGGMNLRVSSDVNVATNFTDLRVTGGNSVNSIYSIGDGWVDVTFSWADSTTTGTVNRAAIKSFQFRFTSFGSKSTTVRFKSLSRIDAVGPFGIVSFDDGWSSAQLALPKLAALNFPPVMYVIAELVGTANYMTLAELAAWEDTYNGEVAAHCYALATHNATNAYASLTLAQAEADIQQLRAFVRGSNGISRAFRGAKHFSWPKGEFNQSLENIARRYFQTAAMATSPFVAQCWPTANPLRLARYPVVATTTPAQIQAEAQKAVANGTGVQFMFHQIKASGATGDTEYNLADFEAAMDLVAATGLPMRTVSQVVDAAY